MYQMKKKKMKYKDAITSYYMSCDFFQIPSKIVVRYD